MKLELRHIKVAYGAFHVNQSGLPKSVPSASLPKPGILDGYWVKPLRVRGFCHMPSGYRLQRYKPLNFYLLSKIGHIIKPKMSITSAFLKIFTSNKLQGV